MTGKTTEELEAEVEIMLRAEVERLRKEVRDLDSARRAAVEDAIGRRAALEAASKTLRDAQEQLSGTTRADADGLLRIVTGAVALTDALRPDGATNLGARLIEEAEARVAEYRSRAEEAEKAAIALSETLVGLTASEPGTAHRHATAREAGQLIIAEAEERVAAKYRAAEYRDTKEWQARLREEIDRAEKAEREAERLSNALLGVLMAGFTAAELNRRTEEPAAALAAEAAERIVAKLAQAEKGWHEAERERAELARLLICPEEAPLAPHLEELIRERNDARAEAASHALDLVKAEAKLVEVTEAARKVLALPMERTLPVIHAREELFRTLAAAPSGED